MLEKILDIFMFLFVMLMAIIGIILFGTLMELFITYILSL